MCGSEEMDESEWYQANNVLLLALRHLWDTKDGGRGLAPQTYQKKILFCRGKTLKRLKVRSESWDPQ